MAIITSNISASNATGQNGTIGLTGSLHVRSGSGEDGGYLIFDQITTSGGPAVPGGNTGVLFVSGNNGGVVDIWFKEPGGTSVNLSAEGDITAVRASYGLEGGGTSGDVALGIDDSLIPILSASNWFTADMHVSGNVTFGDSNTDKFIVASDSYLNDVYVSGSTTIGNNDVDELTVNATTTFDATVDFDKDVYFASDADLYASGNVQLGGETGGNIYLSGNISDAVFTGTLTASPGSATGTAIKVPMGHVIFNEAGMASDFRVETDNNTHALFVDGSEDHVVFGASDTAGTDSWFFVSGSKQGNGHKAAAVFGGDTWISGNLSIGYPGVNDYESGDGGPTMFEMYGKNRRGMIYADGNNEQLLLFGFGSDGNLESATNKQDVKFYLSGSATTDGVRSEDEARALFQGDVTISGTLRTGLPTQTPDQKPTIIAGQGVEITTGSFGSATLALGQIRIDLDSDASVGSVKGNHGITAAPTTGKGDVVLKPNASIIPILSASNWFTGGHLGVTNGFYVSGSSTFGNAVSDKVHVSASISFGQITTAMDGTFECHYDASFAKLMASGSVTLGMGSMPVALNGSTTDVDAAGAVTVNSSAGTISVGNDDVDQNINIGTAGTRTIVIGADGGATTTQIHSDGGNLLLDAGTRDITITGDIMPSADISYDLGSSALRFKNVYTGDLHLANERGNYTLVEEPDMLTIRNNRSGKWFRLMMEEIDPTGRDDGMRGPAPLFNLGIDEE